MTRWNGSSEMSESIISSTFSFQSLSSICSQPPLLDQCPLYLSLILELTIRSTNLDSWSLAQLRTIKAGGNASIADFFTKHNGQNLLPPTNTDARGRYTSRQAGLYKEELARRIEADISK